MSVRYEWFDAGMLGVDGVTGGGLVGEHEVDDGKFALVLSGDECTVLQGTQAELQYAVDRMQRAVNDMTTPTKRGEKRVRDLEIGDEFMFPGDEDFRTYTENDGDEYLRQEDDDAVVFVIEPVKEKANG